MDHFILSNSKVRVPRIIYGTAWKKAATENLVSLAIQNGFRGIDTACQPKHYEEAGVGDGIAVTQ
jgi:diketogulonate reductase-like aldo/keto reductase